MKEDLGFSSQSIGFHFELLWAVGIVASPLMGHLSDRLGRKPVLVPALLGSGNVQEKSDNQQYSIRWGSRP